MGKGSDHLQLIKFWPSRAPGKGVCGRTRSVCVSLSIFFIVVVCCCVTGMAWCWPVDRRDQRRCLECHCRESFADTGERSWFIFYSQQIMFTWCLAGESWQDVCKPSEVYSSFLYHSRWSPASRSLPRSLAAASQADDFITGKLSGSTVQFW